MGVFDKIKNILFDEDDTEIDELPRKQPKKNKLKPSGFKDYSDTEDTISEVKVPEEKDDNFEFEGVDYSSISRTRLREEEYKDSAMEEPVREPVVERPREQVVERPVERPIERPTVVERPQVRVEEPEETHLQSNFDKKRYELPPQKEVDYGPRDMSRYINQDNQRKGSKPFTVTPVISPVYGILDKNYKPEEIAEKSKPQPIEQVRERMFGPVSYQGEEIPEPTKYEESDETLTELLIKEEKAKKELERIQAEKAAAEASMSIESEMDETAEYEPVEVIHKTPIIEEEPVVEDTYEEVEEPTNDISDLINSIKESDFEEPQEDVIEEDYYKTESPSDFDEVATYEPVTRDEEVKESLDNTIETDLFNLIDSMYNTDERE